MYLSQARRIVTKSHKKVNVFHIA